MTEQTKIYHMVIGGETGGAGSHFEVKNPSTGAIVGLAPQATTQDLDRAVAAANDAFQTWSLKSDEDLKAACEAVTAKIAEHSEELAELITLEQGRPG